MVTPMTKYTFLLHHLSVEQFIGELGDLGVVDVTVVGAEYNDAERELIAKINDAKSLREKIVRFGSENKDICQKVGDVKLKDANLALSKFKELNDANEKLEAKRSKYATEAREVSIWGKFDASLFSKLENNGVKLNFYVVSAKDFDLEWSETHTIEIIESDAHNVSFVVVTLNGAEAPEFGRYQPIKQPKYDVSTIDVKQSEINAAIELNNEELAKIYANCELVDSYIRICEHSLKEQLLKSGNKKVAEGKVYVVEGWVPEGKYDVVDNLFAVDGEIVVFKDKPTLEDNPPILLKNNKFAKMCEMISKLYSMPSYHELDLTPFFAPFFIFFVGFCFGDFGYALLLLIGAVIAKFMVKSEAMKPILSLVMWCCFAAMVMGTLTGAFFGIDLSKFELFKDVKFMGQMDLFSFSLVVGLIQIVYAMFVKVYARIKYQGFKYAISTLSWACVILTCGVAYLFPEFLPFSSLAFKIIIGALLLLNILFFDASKKNLLINFGGGTWELYNAVTGLLGDVLSYIRLFALGLSSGIIASVFNDLAVGLSPDVPIVKYIVMALILLIGHGINMFMSAIGSFVHPLRLTFVEFYKNAGFEGGGREYSPFKNEKNV